MCWTVGRPGLLYVVDPAVLSCGHHLKKIIIQQHVPPDLTAHSRSESVSVLFLQVQVHNIIKLILKIVIVAKHSG
jgi:hypothetical protein